MLFSCAGGSAGYVHQVTQTSSLCQLKYHVIPARAPMQKAIYGFQAGVTQPLFHEPAGGYFPLSWYHAYPSINDHNKHGVFCQTVRKETPCLNGDNPASLFRLPGTSFFSY